MKPAIAFALTASAAEKPLTLHLPRRLVVQIRVLAALRRVPIEEWLAEYLAPILGTQLPEVVRLLHEANRTGKVDLLVDALAAAGDIPKARYRNARTGNLPNTLAKELGPLLEVLSSHQPPLLLRGPKHRQPSRWGRQTTE